MLCKVEKCRYNNYHVTKGHKCGLCQTYGHGIIECQNPLKKQNLDQFLNDQMPDHLVCTRPRCQHSNLHSINSHQCKLCNGFHSKHNCNLNLEFIQRINSEMSNPILSSNVGPDSNDQIYKLDCPICKTKCEITYNKNKIFSLDKLCLICETNNIDIYLQCGHINVCYECVKKMSHPNNNLNQTNLAIIANSFGPNVSYDDLEVYFINKFAGINGKVYHMVYAGMGCYWIIRRNGIGELIEIHFSHSDDVYDQRNIDATTSFIENYIQI